MKKVLLATTFFLFIHALQAQRNRQEKDSLKVMLREVADLRQQYRDSLHANTRYIELTDRLQDMQAASDNYGGFIIYTSLTSANFNRFNAQHTPDNFSALSAPMVSIGYGFSFKKNRRIFDINVGTLGFPKKSKSGNEHIKTSFTCFFQLEWGYDLIRNNRVNIYPYAGIGLRSSSLDYKSNVETNTLFSNVTDIIQNDRSFEASIMELGYQAGFGAEYVLSPPPKGGLLIFIKGGTNRAFRNKSFDIEGVRYQPDFHYGDLTGSIGFKFFGR